MSRKIKIAIVGCGASAVSFLRYLIKFSAETDQFNIKIKIFDSSESFGVGLAYQDDFDHLIVNRPIQTMSAHALNLDEFHTWFEQRPDLTKHRIVESNLDDDKRVYISRNIFGRYLQDVLANTISIAKKNGIEVELVQEKVVQVDKNKSYVVTLSNDEQFIADFVVLCTGNNKPKNIYNLNHNHQYINNPYPISSKFKAISHDKDIGIIGSSLTAIDIAISLKKLGHTGKITMLSRTLTYPRVRGKITPYILKYFTPSRIHEIKNKKGFLTLRDALRLLRLELTEIGYSWRDLLVENTQEGNFIQYMKSEINATKHERKWQSVLSATNKVVEMCWHYLNTKSKKVFLSKYNRLWLSNRSPIPVVNAKEILRMYTSGQLTFCSSLNEIKHKEIEKKFLAIIGEEKIPFDYIVNATGPSRYVTKDDHLLIELINGALLREHHFGGLDVDFESSSAIDNAGEINPYLRVLGHNTSGVYYYTSSLEMIAKRSSKVAHSLVKFINHEFAHG